MRKSGILLHPTSLLGIAGIGSIGGPARNFLDFLLRSGQKIWQMLPLSPTDDGGCPYNSTSAMALNTRLIDLEDLCTEAWAHILSAEDLLDAPTPEQPEHADFRMARLYKTQKVELAFERLKASKTSSSADILKAYESFCKTSSFWLDDFVLFEALQQQEASPLWTSWPVGLRDRKSKSLVRVKKTLASELELRSFAQFVVHRQWLDLHAQAKAKGIQLMGDVPIFVSHNSVDVWCHRDLFELNAKGESEAVAGVPPDYFAPQGQLWGNPLYDWKRLKETKYKWWLERLGALSQLVDIVRIDHFRGFESFWSVAATEKTAINGRWLKGPGMDFFKAVAKALPELELIAEDLGLVTPGVEKLRVSAGLHGMRVIQFGFPLDNANDHHAPHMHTQDSVVYCGTHDNDTTLGWYQSLDDAHRNHIRHYLSIDGRDIVWQMMQTALSSTADYCILTAQDLLELDTRSRMNVPGVADGNWTWRLKNTIPGWTGERLCRLTKLYGR